MKINMYKRKLLLLAVILGVIASLFSFSCSGNNDEKLKEESQALAYTTVTHEPTFEFDGTLATLKLVDTQKLASGDGWVFTYTYESSHAGYGDRTNMSKAQVVTQHTAIITIQKKKVVSAIMDGKWDMILQKTVS
jgi:hypothetical protein